MVFALAKQLTGRTSKRKVKACRLVSREMVRAGGGNLDPAARRGTSKKQIGGRVVSDKV